MITKCETWKKLWSIFSSSKDIVDIIKIYISNDNWEDRRVKTHYKGTGEVNPKSAFRVISNYDPNTLVASTKWKHIWRLPIPQNLITKWKSAKVGLARRRYPRDYLSKEKGKRRESIYTLESRKYGVSIWHSNEP